MEEDTATREGSHHREGTQQYPLEKWIGARNSVRRIYPFLKSVETVFKGWLDPVTVSQYGYILLVMNFPTPSVHTILLCLLTALLQPE